MKKVLGIFKVPEGSSYQKMFFSGRNLVWTVIGGILIFPLAYGVIVSLVAHMNALPGQLRGLSGNSWVSGLQSLLAPLQGLYEWLVDLPLIGTCLQLVVGLIGGLIWVGTTYPILGTLMAGLVGVPVIMAVTGNMAMIFRGLGNNLVRVYLGRIVFVLGIVLALALVVFVFNSISHKVRVFNNSQCSTYHCW